jgi:hypothetical protein
MGDIAITSPSMSITRWPSKNPSSSIRVKSSRVQFHRAGPAEGAVADFGGTVIVVMARLRGSLPFYRYAFPSARLTRLASASYFQLISRPHEELESTAKLDQSFKISRLFLADGDLPLREHVLQAEYS